MSDTPRAGQAPAERRDAPLAMDANTFRAIGHRIVDLIAERLDAVPQGPVTRDETPAALREAFGLSRPLPEHGVPAGPLLEQVTQLLFEHSLFNGHPRFLGYITSSPAAASASTWRRSAETSMRRSLPVGIQRIEAVPSPERSAAFWIHVCVSAEA